MRLRERSSALVFSLAAIAFALLAGVAIPLSGAQSSGPGWADWTPPPTTTPRAAAARPTSTSAPTATAVRTATPAPSPVRVKPTSVPTATATTQALARILQNAVNLRAGPGTRYAVVATAKKGTEFEITGRSEDSHWVRLCCIAGKPAWAAVELIELAGRVEGLPVMR